jgi:circadian clock protein KaiC
MSLTPRERIPTGVPGLDHVLHGGLLREGFYLLQGPPGSGKTTIALQYVRGRLQAGESCLYISLTETRRDLETACTSHGWSADELHICDLSRSAANLSGEPETSIFHPAETELGETTKAIFEAVQEADPQHVVFDGLSEMRLLAGAPLLYRRQVLALKELFAERRSTVLLLDDGSAPFDGMSLESLVGGSIVLERIMPQYGGARRRMFVSKVRGSTFRDGFHDYDILQGGLVVYPRLVAAEHHETFDRQLFPSQVDNLDAMVGGGLSRGSTTLFLGPAGVGKSTVTMQFAVAALQRGHKVAIYMFDEVLDTLIDRVDRICLGRAGAMMEFVDQGLLRARQVDPAEMTPGAFAHEVREAVEGGADMIVIDSLNGYLNAMPEERFLTTHLHELFSYLNQQGIVTLFVVAQHGMLVGGATPGGVDVSYLADTVLLFRYFENRGEIQQALSVFKKRTGTHERTLRQIRISSSGLVVGEPLREFHGVMTGVPNYDGSTAMLGEHEPGEGGSIA